jgi:hypothetical protein
VHPRYYGSLFFGGQIDLLETKKESLSDETEIKTIDALIEDRKAIKHFLDDPDNLPDPYSFIHKSSQNALDVIRGYSNTGIMAKLSKLKKSFEAIFRLFHAKIFLSTRSERQLAKSRDVRYPGQLVSVKYLDSNSISKTNFAFRSGVKKMTAKANLINNKFDPDFSGVGAVKQKKRLDKITNTYSALASKVVIDGHGSALRTKPSAHSFVGRDDHIDSTQSSIAGVFEVATRNNNARLGRVNMLVAEGLNKDISDFYNKTKKMATTLDALRNARLIENDLVSLKVPSDFTQKVDIKPKLDALQEQNRDVYKSVAFEKSKMFEENTEANIAALHEVKSELARLKQVADASTTNAKQIASLIAQQLPGIDAQISQMLKSSDELIDFATPYLATLSNAEKKEMLKRLDADIDVALSNLSDLEAFATTSLSGGSKEVMVPLRNLILNKIADEKYEDLDKKYQSPEFAGEIDDIMTSVENIIGSSDTSVSKKEKLIHFIQTSGNRNAKGQTDNVSTNVIENSPEIQGGFAQIRASANRLRSKKRTIATLIESMESREMQDLVQSSTSEDSHPRLSRDIHFPGFGENRRSSRGYSRS